MIQNQGNPPLEDEEVLAHHGVKGMKWGVRHDPGHEGEQVSNRKLAKLDKKFEKKASKSAWLSINNAMASDFNSKIGSLNDKYEGKDLTKDPAANLKYNKEAKTLLLSSLNKATKNYGSNPSGTKKLKVISSDDPMDLSWHLEYEDVKHADVLPSFRLKRNAIGHILSITPDKALEHTLETEEFLEHHGIKGMKWGHRKAESSGGGSDSSGSSKPGVVSRGVAGARKVSRKAAINLTDHQIDIHERFRDNKGIDTKILTALDRNTWGRNGRFEGFQNARIAELERSKERIAAGELTARTLLFGPQYTRK